MRHVMLMTGVLFLVTSCHGADFTTPQTPIITRGGVAPAKSDNVTGADNGGIPASDGQGRNGLPASDGGPGGSSGLGQTGNSNNPFGNLGTNGNGPGGSLPGGGLPGTGGSGPGGSTGSNGTLGSNGTNGQLSTTSNGGKATLGPNLSSTSPYAKTLSPSLMNSNGGLVACPPQAQRVLILDFKSGWWAGDGGNLFKKIVSSLYTACAGSVTLEYHHIVTDQVVVTNGGGVANYNLVNNGLLVPDDGLGAPSGTTFQTAFRDPTWASYTEVWILSGSSSDPLDVPVSDPMFLQILQAAASTPAGIFIGAGFGAITHGNMFAQDLNVGASFTATQPEGALLNPMAGVQMLSTLGPTQMANHVLFSNGANVPADVVNVAGLTAYGDNISSQGGVTVIAMDNHGSSTLAVGNPNGRKVIMDADLPRYYTIWPNESAPTLQLLRNILVFLAR